MQPSLILVLAPLFDDDLGFGATAEPLHRQALVSELARQRGATKTGFIDGKNHFWKVAAKG